MKVPKVSDYINKIKELLPKKDIEKIILKALIAVWIVVFFATFGLKTIDGTSYSIEKKIDDMATKVKISPSVSHDEIKGYETTLNSAKNPEPIAGYGQKIKRDPFSKYTEEVPKVVIKTTEHDFTLKSVGNVPLPVVYRGFIELPDKIIGQINWKDSTRFVEEGAFLNGYKILKVTKEGIEAVDENGRKWGFLLNKPVLSDKLNAVLYDNISKKNYTVEAASVIDDYKVIDIQPGCVILFSKGSEIKLTKQ